MTRDTDETARNVSSNVQAQKKKQPAAALFTFYRTRTERERARQRPKQRSALKSTRGPASRRRRATPALLYWFYFLFPLCFSSLSFPLSFPPSVPPLFSDFTRRGTLLAFDWKSRLTWRACSLFFASPRVFFSAKRPGRGEILWISSLPLSLSLSPITKRSSTFAPPFHRFCALCHHADVSRPSAAYIFLRACIVKLSSAASRKGRWENDGSV